MVFLSIFFVLYGNKGRGQEGSTRCLVFGVRREGAASPEGAVRGRPITAV